MSEVIFGSIIEEINNWLQQDAIISIGSLLGYENRLREIIMQRPNAINNLFINVNTNKSEFVEKVLKALQTENGKFCLDTSRLVLTGNLVETDCESFSKIERIELPYSNIKDIKAIKKKFPNLKEISVSESYNTQVENKDIDDNLINLFDYAEFANVVKLGNLDNIKTINNFINKSDELRNKFAISSDGRVLINLEKYFEHASYLQYEDLDCCGNMQSIKDFISSKEELKEKFIISSDGMVINLDNIRGKYFKDSLVGKKLSIDIEDLKKLNIEDLKNVGCEIKLIISSANDLSVQDVDELKKKGIPVSGIEIFSEGNTKKQNEEYDLETYCAIRGKLDELVDGIDLRWSEKKRFAEVYKRIGNNIVYDTPAAYPVTNMEKEYSKEEDTNCRNLKNGLLYGKCVCAGYADILRNALSLVDIEAVYVSGDVLIKSIDENDTEFEKLSKKYNYYKDKETGKIDFVEGHAWNKVKLDNVWYNVDATWDANKIRMGKIPTDVFKSDTYIKEEDKKLKFEGPNCEKNLEASEVEKIFDDKHFFIGNRKVPNMKYFIGTIKQVVDGYKNFVKTIGRYSIKAKERLEDRLFIKDKNKPKMLEAPKSDENMNKSEQSLHSWDLRNWNMDSKSISIQKNYNSAKNQEKGKDNERDGL